MVDIIITVIFWAFIAVLVAVYVLGILGIMLLPFITAWSWILLTRSEWRIARATREQAQALQQRAARGC
jgi:hypothetical protein